MMESSIRGVMRLNISTAKMGTKITMHRIRIMSKSEISMERPKRILTRAGSVKGTNGEEMTTMTSTRLTFAFTRVEIKGATTPVDIPVRSKAAIA